MAKKETAKTVEKTVNTGFIDNVEALGENERDA